MYLYCALCLCVLKGCKWLSYWQCAIALGYASDTVSCYKTLCLFRYGTEVTLPVSNNSIVLHLASHAANLCFDIACITCSVAATLRREKITPFLHGSMIPQRVTVVVLGDECNEESTM